MLYSIYRIYHIPKGNLPMVELMPTSESLLKSMSFLLCKIEKGHIKFSKSSSQELMDSSSLWPCDFSWDWLDFSHIFLVTSYNVFVKTRFSCTSSMCWILCTAFTIIRNYADSHNDTKFVLSPCIFYSLSSLCLTYCSAIVFFDCPCLMAASICQPRVSAG